MIIDQYGLRKRFPDVLVRWLDEGRMPETQSPEGPAFRNAHSSALGMRDLFHCAHHASEASRLSHLLRQSTTTGPLPRARTPLLKKIG